jgi:predicted transcriptional regulator
MEERKFTLRISPEEGANLEKLREFLNLSTDTAAIRHAITHYIELEKKILKLQQENNNLKIALTNLHNRIKDFKTSFERLTEIA